MKNKIVLLLLVTGLLFTGCNSKTKSKEKNNENIIKYTSDIEAVASLEDEMKDNSVWCGTFNIVWNILKDEYVKGDIKMTPEPVEVINLNKSTFNKSELNENSYYSKFGKQTPELKKEIETAIKEKFNQKSDILDNFTWEKDSQDDFIYTMLYKKFNFEQPFKQLDNAPFNKSTDKKYKYFGIDKKNRDGIKQVTVLYYNNNNEYAVKIDTKENDQIILVKGNNEKNFLDSFNKVKEEEKKYDGKKELQTDETLMVPYIEFNTFKSFDNLKNKPFKYADETDHVIAEAIQTIKFELNETGGKIKSEAAISVKETAIMPKPEIEIRHFDFDSDYKLFLIEKDKNLPYFAANITSLDKFQKNDSK